jgi:hypothetical protein
MSPGRSVIMDLDNNAECQGRRVGVPVGLMRLSALAQQKVRNRSCQRSVGRSNLVTHSSFTEIYSYKDEGHLHLNYSYDINRREFYVFLPLILGTLLMGIYPKVFLDPLDASILNLVFQLKG